MATIYREQTAAPRIPVHMRLDRDLWLRFRRHAYNHGTTMTGIIERLVAAEIDEPRFSGTADPAS